LMRGEVDSTLFAIPDAWRPYIDDPGRQWPYERGQRCPPERFAEARDRMLGMLFCLTAGMIDRKVADLDAINYLAEKALAFREGPPASIEAMGAAEATAIARRFLEGQRITRADEVAPLAALDPAHDPQESGWGRLYVGTSVQGGVGLLSLKRTTVSHLFIAE